MKRPARSKSLKPAIATSGAPGKVAIRLVTRCIETDDDVKAGVIALTKKCRFLRLAHQRTGHPPLRRRTGGFEGLVRIVNAQQLSVASASAIFARLEATLRPLTCNTMLNASDETLRGCGLSRPKIRTLRAISEAVSGGLDLDALSAVPEAEAVARLTAVSGVGPWTADVYLMFCVGHADVFASGDLALQIATQALLGLDKRPTARELSAIAAERWQPWRSIAARLLWAYYAEIKKQGDAMPA